MAEYLNSHEFLAKKRSRQSCLMEVTALKRRSLALFRKGYHLRPTIEQSNLRGLLRRLNDIMPGLKENTVAGFHFLVRQGN